MWQQTSVISVSSDLRLHLLYLYPVICCYICYMTAVHLLYLYPVICYNSCSSLLYLYPVICSYICYICIQWSATSVISVSSDLLLHLYISVSSDLLLHLLYLYPVICSRHLLYLYPVIWIHLLYLYPVITSVISVSSDPDVTATSVISVSSDLLPHVLSSDLLRSV